MDDNKKPISNEMVCLFGLPVCGCVSVFCMRDLMLYIHALPCVYELI